MGRQAQALAAIVAEGAVAGMLRPTGRQMRAVMRTRAAAALVDDGEALHQPIPSAAL
ncbi:hypothetical protein [Altericroceibacterium endophyticum]|uniref:Uncharacterized protein n=1 Tax=Altericroceibacterium endophyticum TaxID=1808508 RepID=A0A6I4T1W0_9SPHN|nr:hypothetical protein [Altericroceibacterium endophyticum]MXO64878.1 hypothetical protein [Altericroceibacterium endophyticum]